MEPSSQSDTASQRVFSIPEILGIIFAQNTGNEDGTPSHHSDLLRWALVNSRWYSEAIPLLWARPRSSLAVIMANVKPTRRQYHANYVSWALVLYISRFEKDAFAENGVLHGLVFPKLTGIFASIHIPKHHYLRRHFPSGALHVQRRVGQFEEEINLDFVLRPISVSHLWPHLTLKLYSLIAMI
ncbi:hypothetical protein N7530_004975 [Penicillium desertorum]|uniref:Uncharacterized protein n=1 Tax=Penicillium desertorum TaxID=1303715 RepID=A0A9X0BRE3_9EURO|nr:hypothetical protein N7530_004975 [Penicillium desertorum]